MGNAISAKTEESDATKELTDEMGSCWINLFMQKAGASLFAAQENSQLDSACLSSSERGLHISLSKDQECPLVISNNFKCILSEGSVFRGHDVGEQIFSNPDGYEMKLVYNEGTQSLGLESVVSSVDYSGDFIYICG